MMARAYERYWVDNKGVVIGNQGLPHNQPVEIGLLDAIMESYFVLHREKYGGAGLGADKLSDGPKGD